MDELQYVQSQDKDMTLVADSSKLSKYKQWFREAVEGQQKWRAIALEDRDFYSGK